MKKNLLMLLLTLFISSCATIPDVPILKRVDFDKCIYAYTMSDRKGVIAGEDKLEGKTCIDHVDAGFILPVESWMKLKKSFIKACRKHRNKCNGAGDWQDKMEFLDAQEEVIE